MLADFVHRHDLRMIEPGDRLGLGLKAGQVRRRRQLASQYHLERHDPVQAQLPRLEDDAHAAAAQLREQFVVAKQPWQASGRSVVGGHFRGCQGWRRGILLAQWRIDRAWVERSEPADFRPAGAAPVAGGDPFGHQHGRPQLAQIASQRRMLLRHPIDVRNSLVPQFIGQLGQQRG